MKTLLIYSPQESNSLFSSYLDHIVNRFQETDQFITLYRLNNLSKLETFMEGFSVEEYGKVLIAGDSSTLNQCISVLMKHDIRLPLGIYSLGTVNDIAQSFGLQKSIEELTEIFVRHNTTASDIGMVNDRYFLNAASLGFMNDISRSTNPETKSSLGVLAYYLKGLEELPVIKSMALRFETAEEIWEETVTSVLVMNGISAGGFRRIAPQAVLNDGLLDVVIFRKSPRRQLIPLLLQMINGEHLSNPYVKVFQTSSLTISASEPFIADLDGVTGCELPLTFSVGRRTLRILTQQNDDDPRGNIGPLSLHEVKAACEGVAQSLMESWLKALDPKGMNLGSSDIGTIMSDLPRHNALDYGNRRTLGADYFKVANASLDNGYLYIILSSTGTAAGEIIRKVTGKEYSHASLSFDEELETIISYNGGNQVYSPGMNMEMIEYFYRKPEANILIYKLKATREQKLAVLNTIENIDKNGSSYNVLGLFVPYSHKENIMFCSQFVYTMLQCGGLSYFDKKPEEVKPTDFVELDYQRVLSYCGKVFLKDVCESGEII